MSDWYMEIIDIRHRGSKTGKGAAWATEAEARTAFDAARRLMVEPKRAEFLVDLHDGEDNLLDTIQIDAAGFETLIGKAPRSADYYDQYDVAYWMQAKAART